MQKIQRQGKLVFTADIKTYTHTASEYRTESETDSTDLEAFGATLDLKLWSSGLVILGVCVWKGPAVYMYSTPLKVFELVRPVQVS